jgi:hypothetical protein
MVVRGYPASPAAALSRDARACGVPASHERRSLLLFAGEAKRNKLTDKSPATKHDGSRRPSAFDSWRRPPRRERVRVACTSPHSARRGYMRLWVGVPLIDRLIKLLD